MSQCQELPNIHLTYGPNVVYAYGPGILCFRMNESHSRYSMKESHGAGLYSVSPFFFFFLCPREIGMVELGPMSDIKTLQQTPNSPGL